MQTEMKEEANRYERRTWLKREKIGDEGGKEEKAGNMEEKR